jgi:hypothetical protein
MRDRRSLIAADIGNARLQQRFGHGKNGLAFEQLAGTEPERLNFTCERSLCHDRALSGFE